MTGIGGGWICGKGKRVLIRMRVPIDCPYAYIRDYMYIDIYIYIHICQLFVRTHNIRACSVCVYIYICSRIHRETEYLHINTERERDKGERSTESENKAVCAREGERAHERVGDESDERECVCACCSVLQRVDCPRFLFHGLAPPS